MVVCAWRRHHKTIDPRMAPARDERRGILGVASPSAGRAGAQPRREYATRFWSQVIAAAAWTAGLGAGRWNGAPSSPRSKRALPGHGGRTMRSASTASWYEGAGTLGVGCQLERR